MIFHLISSMVLRLLTSLHLQDGIAARRYAPRHLCPLHLHIGSFKPEYACVLNRSVASNSLWPQGLQPTRLLCPWDSPGKNTGVGCHLPPTPPGNLPNPGIKPASPALQADSRPLSYSRSPTVGIFTPLANTPTRSVSPQPESWLLDRTALDSKEIKPVNPKGNQTWIFIGRTDAKAETPVLWLLDVKNWLTGKDPDAGKDCRQEEKGATEYEMVGWHHQLSGHEF